MRSEVTVPEGDCVLTTTLRTTQPDLPVAIPLWRRVLRGGTVVAHWRKFGLCQYTRGAQHIGRLRLDRLFKVQPGDVVQLFTDFGAVLKIETKWDS